jgi:hypothetical protein
VLSVGDDAVDNERKIAFVAKHVQDHYISKYLKKRVADFLARIT